MMNYRRLAARAGLPAWMLLAPLALSQETPTENEPAQPEKTEETETGETTPTENDSPAPTETDTPAPTENTTPGKPALPKPKLPTPVDPNVKPEDAATDLPEVEDPLDGIPVSPGVPLPDGDPLLNPAGDGSILPLVGPEAPDPDDLGLLSDEAPTFGQGLGENRPSNTNLLDPVTTLSGRDNDTQGLVFSIGVTETYSSNLELDETDPLDIFYTTIEPEISFRSAPDGGAENILAFSYSPSFDIYHDSAVDDSTNHRFATIVNHNGDKLKAQFTADYYQATEASRFTETLSENTNFSTQLDLNYRLSDKISLFSDFNYSRAESDAGDADASDLFGASLSGMYTLSPKTRIGPTIRYAKSKSDTNGDISSFAFGADVRYRPTDKIQVQSTFGIESVDPDGGDSDTSPTATLGFTYRPSSIWSFNGEIRYEAIPINTRTDGTVGYVPGEDPLGNLNGPASDGDQQISASLGVNYTPGDDWRVSATLNHRTSPSFVNPGQSIVDTTVSLGVARRFNKSELSLRYSFSSTEYEGAPLPPPPGFPRLPPKAIRTSNRYLSTSSTRISFITLT